MNKEIINKINQNVHEPITFMEVCGTHTHEIARSGILDVINPFIKVRSGPGCPVCVSHESYIDNLIKLAKSSITIVTFGDMVRVRGTKYSLEDMKSFGCDVKVIYSPKDICELAIENPAKEYVFAGVGFETTAPVIASVVKIIKSHGLKNVSFLLALKRMEPILKLILSNKNHNINGIIAPGHVASIVGANYFRFISEEYHIATVISGFEVSDFLLAFYFLSTHYQKGSFCNLYPRVVTNQGNLKALDLLNEVFIVDDEYWRGIGKVYNSGFKLKKEYQDYDANLKYNLDSNFITIDSGCICKDIILGIKDAFDCKLFNKTCNPKNPKGPCMVSSEGTCLAYYKYRRRMDG